MQLKELEKLFTDSRRCYHLLGNHQAGVVIGLDLEGRLYSVHKNEVLNRVNPQAFFNQSTADEYFNPGGDGLWPAPEGSKFGYQYATGKWRVPPGLTGARYKVLVGGSHQAVVRAEIDLINSQGLGLPLAFERQVTLQADEQMTVKVTETIEYLGRQPLTRQDGWLVPWTLAQFDSSEGSEVVFPGTAETAIYDLYDSSLSRRHYDGQLWHTCTAGGPRYQIGLEPEVPWIEYRNPQKALTVRRQVEPLPKGLDHIDITDRPPHAEPLPLRVCLSVYSDPAHFMEIEAAGGAPEVLLPGTRLSLDVTTIYRRT